VRATAPQAARLSGCSPQQLATWERTGLVRPDADATYGFRDVVALRVVRSLLDAGLSLAKVKRAVRELVAAGDDLAGLRLVTDGDRVWACYDDGQILDALRRGQLALFVAVGQFAADIEAEIAAFDAERDAFVAGLEPESDVSDGSSADASNAS